jgi:hypothetical protein
VQRAAIHRRDALGFNYKPFWGDPPNLCIVARDGHDLAFGQILD